MKTKYYINLLAIKCKRLIHADLLSPISLSSLAKELGVSEEQDTREKQNFRSRMSDRYGLLLFCTVHIPNYSLIMKVLLSHLPACPCVS